MRFPKEKNRPGGESPADSGPRGPVEMTQEQVDTLIAGGRKAGEIRKRLLSEIRSSPAAPAAQRSAKASPVPVGLREIADLRKSGKGKKVRVRIQEAPRPAGSPPASENKARPSEAPPYLRRK